MTEAGNTLERNLGLYTVITISLGAMIGSGIFVLPGLASKIAGPGVVLAYLIAGLLVVPAALSMSEMATAMPYAGGTYLYIDRAMGPLMGTIAGFGVWFSLVFKSAFALVGLGAYLSLFEHLDARPVAIGLAVLLTVINIVGIRQTAHLQAVLVTTVMAALVAFVVIGFPEIERAAMEPFLPEGIRGLLAATGLVFVSYAGVTKVASIAEEVRRPRRTLPRAILPSIAIMVLVYPAVVLVIVATGNSSALSTSLTPVSTAAANFMGPLGVDLISIVAILALISMANAGLLASSRYPFAMSRNSLAPRFLQHVGKRSGTPTISIALTGAIMVVLIEFIPLIELAKLASAFQLLVFALVNLSVIAFRESHVRWYRPRFRSPLYPWIQLFGIAGSLLLLTLMGLVPLLGALAIVGGGVLWYQGFGRSRASRESASLDALRMRNNARLLSMTEMALSRGAHSRVLIPVLTRPTDDRGRDLIRLARHLAGMSGEIDVIWFTDGQDHPQDAAAREAEFSGWATEAGIEVRTGTLASNDRRETITRYVWDHGIDLVLADLPHETRFLRPETRDLKWVRDNVECDTAFLRNRELGPLQSIVIMGSGGPFDILKISMASQIAQPEGSSIRFVHVVNEDATEAQIAATRDYHRRLDELTPVETTSSIERSEDLVRTLTRLGRGANLVVIGAAAQRFRMFSDLADRIAGELDCPVLLVHARDSHRRTTLGRLLERFIY